MCSASCTPPSELVDRLAARGLKSIRILINKKKKKQARGQLIVASLKHVVYLPRCFPSELISPPSTSAITWSVYEWIGESARGQGAEPTPLSLSPIFSPHSSVKDKAERKRMNKVGGGRVDETGRVCKKKIDISPLFGFHFTPLEAPCRPRDVE